MEMAEEAKAIRNGMDTSEGSARPEKGLTSAWCFIAKEFEEFHLNSGSK